ncbi:cell division protein FtsK [Pilimelia anulata]|uniref:Cell division protein FtsK n=1 Tax=Pilimelia anulata TaxID=53371 RepID=A0A8J3BHW4_9ACTN|nr:FtsK/SpoIIIE domain-containing protein [Pilimelia anulata]GGK09558.1 cell division protein FtsK [Pilimelia anulata]
MTTGLNPPRLRLINTDTADPDDRPPVGDAETVIVDAAGHQVPPTDAAPAPDGDAEPEPVEAPADGGEYGGWQTTSSADRPPVIPAWLRSARARRQILARAADAAAYTVAFHGVRSPKYLAKTLFYAPVGVRRTAWSLLYWATAEQGNFELRQHAAGKGDAFTWQALNRTRSKESRGRWWALGLGAMTFGIGATSLAASGVVPDWGWWAALAAVVPLAARAGRPADVPITDRLTSGPRFTKLTADMVRDALVALSLPGLRERGAVDFMHPGIHRDGPGWLARINLPAGLEAVKVLERRGALSSALRLPVDQVWPTAGPDHAGQLDLWVGYRPASKMGQPAWSLAEPNARTSYFEAAEFGTDQRQRPVSAVLCANNFLIGGRPGSGKSYAGRTIVTIAALDPTVELKIAEYKGTGDFLDLAPLCSTYICGLADDDFAGGLAILNWGLAEAERRGKRIKAAYERGEAPERKVTPELARRPGSGLHPIVIVIDEAHELFGDATVGKEAGAAAERLVKRGRALGITVVIITQIPDKESLPTGITRNVGIRWCLAVPDQVANDMILGTGAYKRGVTGTVYRPGVDAGWGVLTGLAEPTATRSHFPEAKTTASIVARATALRGGVVVGDTVPVARARDLAGDLVAVAARNGQHWTTAAATLVQRWPEAYPTMTGEALSELARAQGVVSTDVKIGGRTLKGYRLGQLRELIAHRDTATPTDGPDGGVNGADGGAEAR